MVPCRRSILNWLCVKNPMYLKKIKKKPLLPQWPHCIILIINYIRVTWSTTELHLTLSLQTRQSNKHAMVVCQVCHYMTENNRWKTLKPTTSYQWPWPYPWLLTPVHLYLNSPGELQLISHCHMKHLVEYIFEETNPEKHHHSLFTH